MPVLTRYTDEREESVRSRAVESLAQLRRDSSFYGPDESEPGIWGIAPFAYNDAEDEHDVLPRANYLTALEALQEHDDSVYEATVRHWAGGIPIHFIVFRVDNHELIETLVDLVDAYESYPVLDDEKHSELEDERWIETLENYLQWGVDEISEYVPGRAEDLAAFLADEHEVYREGDIYRLDLDEMARPWLIAEGIIPADPERGEEPPPRSTRRPDCSAPAPPPMSTNPCSTS